MSANEELLDAQIRHSIYVQRFGGGQVRRYLALLNRADADMVDIIRTRVARIADRGYDTGPATTARLNEVLDSIRQLIAAAHQAANAELTDGLQGFADYERAWHVTQLQTQLPAALSVSAPPLPAVTAAVFKRPFQGRLLSEWMEGIEASRRARVRDAIRIGLVEGQPIDQIVGRIRGTRARGYQDGLLEIDRRGAEAMVRTAVNHTSNAARQEVFADNEALIKGIRWVSTLDGRTTAICQSRDGKVYPVDRGPRPPAHIGCRSATVAVLKSWKELGIDVEDAPPLMRASLNGQVPGDLTYGEWLKRQSAAFQDDVLGKAKGALFRTGKLSLDRFVDKSGKELSLDQLKALEPAAFKQAGLDNPIKPPRGQPADAIAKFLSAPTEQNELLQRLYQDDYETNMAAVRKAKRSQGWSASDESLGAARYYTGEGYQKINQRMRESGGTLDDRKFTALTAEAIRSLPQHSSDPIFRVPTKRQANADRWWDSAVSGETLDLGNQLQSFSKAPAFVNEWDGGTDVIFRIAAPKRGAYIEALTQNPGEHEVLLPPGMVYRVVAKGRAMVGTKIYRVIDLEIGDVS